ncbi:MAG: HAD-IB family phosphatase [Dehalococcoidia bacterium]|nr:HAD-IB family phosphatase [Dehalococcoidia bacterium]
MAPILCIDFDDTIVEQDIASQLLERFADASWTGLRERRRSGELTLEEYSAAAIDLVQAQEEELIAHAMEIARPRAGFMELLDWAHWNDWQSAVVSNGWDLYIDPILKGLGADRIARHCGRARFGYRWRVRYYSPRGVELIDSFKTSYVASYRDQGDFVAYHRRRTIGRGAGERRPTWCSRATPCGRSSRGSTSGCTRSRPSTTSSRSWSETRTHGSHPSPLRQPRRPDRTTGGRRRGRHRRAGAECRRRRRATTRSSRTCWTPMAWCWACRTGAG